MFMSAISNNQGLLSSYIAKDKRDEIRGMLDKNVPLSMDDFALVCFRYREISLRAIANYPELAKTAPFKLLVTLAKRVESEKALIALIDAGAAVTGREKITQYTLLHCALDHGLANAAEKLLDKGVDAQAKLHNGITAVHLACRQGDRYVKVLERLIENNKDALAQFTSAGWTPLHEAASANSIEVVGVLLEAGADRSIPDYGGRTALEVAKFARNNLVVERLEKNNAQYAFSHKNIDKAIAFLKQGETLCDDDIVRSCIGNWTYDAKELLQKYPQAVKLFSNALVARLISPRYASTSHEVIEICSTLIRLGIGLEGKDPATGKTAYELTRTYPAWDLAKKIAERVAK